LLIYVIIYNAAIFSSILTVYKKKQCWNYPFNFFCFFIIIIIFVWNSNFTKEKEYM